MYLRPWRDGVVVPESVPSPGRLEPEIHSDGMRRFLLLVLATIRLLAVIRRYGLDVEEDDVEKCENIGIKMC